MYVDTRLPHLRRVVARPEQGTSGNGQGGVVDGIIEKYCKRPKGVQRAYNMPENVDAEVDFDAIKYELFWLEWDMISSAGNKRPPSTLPYCLNEHNTAYWRRSNGVRVLGSGFYRPDRQPFEQFYYHYIILQRPFGNLDDFISEENDGGTYERQCQIEEVFGDEALATKNILAAVDEDLRRQKVR